MEGELTAEPALRPGPSSQQVRPSRDLEARDELADRVSINAFPSGTTEGEIIVDIRNNYTYDVEALEFLIVYSTPAGPVKAVQGVDFFPSVARTDRVSGTGPIAPSETRRITVDLGSAMLFVVDTSVTLALFSDLTAMGSEESRDKILRARRGTGIELGFWVSVLDSVAALDPSEAKGVLLRRLATREADLAVPGLSPLMARGIRQSIEDLAAVRDQEFSSALRALRIRYAQDRQAAGREFRGKD
jgi:hypothetical protein